MCRPCLSAVEPQFPAQERDPGHRSEAVSPDCWAAGRRRLASTPGPPQEPSSGPAVAASLGQSVRLFLLAGWVSVLTLGCTSKPQALPAALRAALVCPGRPSLLRSTLPASPPACPSASVWQAKLCARVHVGPTPNGVQTGQTLHHSRKPVFSCPLDLCVSCSLSSNWASLVAQLVKNPPAVREAWTRSLVGKTL